MGLFEPDVRYGGRPGGENLTVDDLIIGGDERAMPAVVVHDVTQAIAAARVVAAASFGSAGRSPTLTLRSPPGVARSLGLTGWRALEAAVRQAVPSADVAFCVDCGADPGDAHAALSLGVERLALAPGPASSRVAAIAAAAGAVLDNDPPDLDLAFAHDPGAAVDQLIRHLQ